MSGPTTEIENCPTLREILPEFLHYARVELQFSEQSLLKYQDCVRQIQLMIGDRQLSSYAKSDVTALKSKMLERGNGVARQISILSCLKRILQFCRDELEFSVLDPGVILIPRRPRREVVYLTCEEIERFVRVVPLETGEGKPHQVGVRFRTLVETLLGTAMRIGEALSLDREKVDFERREARIIGKGGKERTVFFTEQALKWLHYYLKQRTDDHPALFVTQDGCRRWKRADIWRPFGRYRTMAGISKRVTPHILRHTAATRLLFNGCPVGHIKDILGHERLETTCRYYLGLDHREAKKAHAQYLTYQR